MGNSEENCCAWRLHGLIANFLSWSFSSNDFQISIIPENPCRVQHVLQAVKCTITLKQTEIIQLWICELCEFVFHLVQDYVQTQLLSTSLISVGFIIAQAGKQQWWFWELLQWNFPATGLSLEINGEMASSSGKYFMEFYILFFILFILSACVTLLPGEESGAEWCLQNKWFWELFGVVYGFFFFYFCLYFW